MDSLEGPHPAIIPAVEVGAVVRLVQVVILTSPVSLAKEAFHTLHHHLPVQVVVMLSFLSVAAQDVPRTTLGSPRQNLVAVEVVGIIMRTRQQPELALQDLLEWQ
ncbi:hypothetical protein [Cronobacter malonaticus]|uniref:hypothetical protein n=1 Tax=Cronobacter malonaticus TaxID=413503 RepID=UPI0005192618|nr:hypothetical protein [Cronobacter malonaticus]